MASRRQSRDIPRCSFPWRSSSGHARKPSTRSIRNGKKHRGHHPGYQDDLDEKGIGYLTGKGAIGNHGQKGQHQHLQGGGGGEYDTSSEDEQYDLLEIRRLMTPISKNDNRYASLARAAGVHSPAPSSVPSKYYQPSEAGASSSEQTHSMHHSLPLSQSHAHAHTSNHAINTASSHPKMATHTHIRSPSRRIAMLDPLPPPLPDKKLRIDTTLVPNGNVRDNSALATPDPHLLRSFSLSTTPELMSSSRLTPPPLRSLSPMTPLSASSFSRNRAGSVNSKPPPPPLNIIAPPRKASLPASDRGAINTTNTFREDPNLAAALRGRSASLPVHSLNPTAPSDTIDPHRDLKAFFGLKQRTLPAVSEAPLQLGLSPGGKSLLTEVLAPSESPSQASHTNKQDEEAASLANADPRDVEVVREENAVVSNEAGNAAQSEEAGQMSPPLSTNSVARASSIISISQSTYNKKLHLQRLQQQSQSSSRQEMVEIAYRPSTGSSYRPSTQSTIQERDRHQPSSPRRSEADSFPHDPLYTPRNSFPSGHGHRDMTSGNSEKSFDLSNVPFKFTKVPPLPIIKHKSSQGPSTPTTTTESASTSRPPLSPLRRHVSQAPPPRSPSLKSGRGSEKSSRRSSSKRASRNAAVGSGNGNGNLTPRLTVASMQSIAAKRTSSSLAHLLAAEPLPRPFPWKPIRVSDAKRQLSPKQLQHLVLQSMREYSSSQKQALVLERFEEVPLELEQCHQRIPELEEAFKTEVGMRESILRTHVACLKVLNGEQGARFGESLVSAVSRSDRLAQEICQLREHVGKIESLRDGHWRAAASLSLAKLNSSYLKAKDQIKEQGEELQKLRAERDAANLARDTTLAELKQLRDLRSSVLTVPITAYPRSSDLTPSTSAFDLARFPDPPLSSKPQTVSPATSSSAESPGPPPSISSRAPLEASDDYRFPDKSVDHTFKQRKNSPPPFCSLPTPPVSVEGPSSGDEGLSASPDSQGSASRLRAFKDRVFSTTRAHSTPPPDSELPWARITSPPPVQLVRQWRSNSTPGLGDNILDPHADQFAMEVETLKFVPPSMHLSGAIDEERISVRSSIGPGSPAAEYAADGSLAERASVVPLEQVEVNNLLAELGGSHGQAFSSNGRQAFRRAASDYSR